MTKTSVFCLHHLTVVLKVPISLQSSAFWYQDHTLTCFFVTIRHCYQLTTVKDVDDKKPWNLFTAFDCRFKGAHFSAIFSFLILLLLLLGCVAFCLSYITFRSRTLVVLMHWKAVSCNWYNQNNKVVLLSILQVNAVEPAPEQTVHIHITHCHSYQCSTVLPTHSIRVVQVQTFLGSASRPHTIHLFTFLSALQRLKQLTAVSYYYYYYYKRKI